MDAVIYDTRACELGEGALWHPGRKQLFWVDILGQRLLSRVGDDALEWTFDECVSAAAWVDDQTLVLSTETGLFKFDIATGAREFICGVEVDDAATRANDGRADPYGGFWISTMGKRAEAGAGTLYRFYKGTVTSLVSNLTIPNAICFSPDGRAAYFADTPTRMIQRFALDAEGWPVGEAEPFIDLCAAGLNPDGAITDAEGALWVAHWGAGQVSRYTRDGRLDRTIPVGGIQATCPAFGGDDLQTLFVTTAWEGMREPDAGQGVVYRVDTGIQGRAEPRVLL